MEEQMWNFFIDFILDFIATYTLDTRYRISEKHRQQLETNFPELRLKKKKAQIKHKITRKLI